MTTAAVALFAGALLGIALISRIPIWLLGAWKERSLFGLFAAHLITYVLVAVVSAYVLADGATPQWNVAFLNFAPPSLLVFLLDVAQMHRREPAPDEPQAPGWFIHSGAEQRGPLATETVRTALTEGSVKSSDWIWRADFKEWVQIQTVDFANKEEEKAPAAASVPDENNDSNYLIRHWQGALSLPVSYWINGLMVAILFIVSYLFVAKLGPVNDPLIGAAAVGMWLGFIAAMLWLSVGIFRSADRYSHTHPKSQWDSAAKAMTVVSCLAMLTIFLRQGVPQIQNLADVTSRASAPRYSLQLLRGNTELMLKGPMDAGSSEAVGVSLKDHPTIATLHLNSPGGELAEADRLVDTILEKNLNTYVSASCSGNCVTVFAAGKTRWLSRSASLDLHKPYSPNVTRAQLDAIMARTRTFLYGRGVAAKFVDRGLAAPPDAAWRPTHAELFDAHLATSYATDAEVAVAGIPLREIKDAETELDKIALYQVLRDRHPRAHTEILAILRDRYVKGQSVAETRKRMWAIIGPIMNDSMSSASETALISFYQVAIDEAEAFAKKDARSCEAFLKGRPDGFDISVLPEPLQKRELAATAELIRSSGSYIGRPIEQKDVISAFRQILAQAEAKGFSAADFQQAMQFKLDPTRNCQSMILFFRSLLGMSPTDRTALLRYMAQQSPTL